MNNLFNLSESEKNRIRGLHLTESNDNRITSVINEQSRNIVKKEECVTINFRSGESEIAGKRYPIDIKWGNIYNLLLYGMRGDRPFITIEAGTSGTGSHSRNRQVMDDRINEAIDVVLENIATFRGPNKLQYSVPVILDKTNINRKYSTIEPGSILPGGEEVPTDPNHPYFDDFQYVKLCFSPTSETPGYGSLADQFFKATIETIGGTNENAVYAILDQLRDNADFMEFNDELKRDYGMDFYEVACDSTAWIKELGDGDKTINVHLRRLGTRPIKC